jgi:hypothetical protein
MKGMTMSTSEKFTFPVVSFRNLETPFRKQGYRDYYSVVNVKALPNLTKWRRINVRDPKLTGAVPEAIREGLRDPEMFLFMNRGIVLVVDSLSFDSKNSVVTVEMKDRNLHGLLDGGHTYNIALDEVNNLEFSQYVKVEILEGFSMENITQVVDARNTSTQVADESLMNLARDFDPLKNALAKAGYYPRIAWKEYEIDENGNPKPIDVRDIIAILTAFDRENFNDNNHPINAYRSKAACLKHFKEHMPAYKKIYPLAQEILALYDQIQEKLPELYNEVRGQTGDVSGGKFGKLTGVSTYKGKRMADLHFLGTKSRYGVPAGFIYPILGAFRALLVEKGGKYVWAKGLKPAELLCSELGRRLADTIGNFALDAKNPSKTGKSPLVWQACYQCVQVAYLTAQ